MSTTSPDLRQRKTADSSTKSDSDENTPTPVKPSTGQLVKVYMDAFADKLPKNIGPHIKTAAPFVAQAVVVIENSIPYFIKIYERCVELWIALAPYKLELLFPAFAGLIMCFFGGSFLTLIAAVEAYHMVGYDTTLKCIHDLKEDFLKVLAETKDDDEVDDDGDGVADVLQITPTQLATRKILLFFRSIDPKRLSSAIAGINAGFLAVVATLKLQFAKAITLGTAIGNVIEVPAKKYFLPLLEAALPAEYRKWAEPAIEYTVRSSSISLAWMVQRVVSAFHSAVRGGLLCARNLIEYLCFFKYIDINHNDTYLDEIAGFALAALGLWFQLSTGFALPFPLNLLLLPFSMAEWFLMWAVNSK